jgi:hypothetical protein
VAKRKTTARTTLPIIPATQDREIRRVAADLALSVANPGMSMASVLANAQMIYDFLRAGERR